MESSKPVGKPNEKAPVTIGDVLHAKKLQEESERQAAIEKGKTAATDKQQAE